MRLTCGHTTRFLDGHDQAVDAELGFLRRHLLLPPTSETHVPALADDL